MGRSQVAYRRRLVGAGVCLAAVVERVGSSLPARCARRFRAMHGRDRAFVIAGQAFTTLIPLLIVIGAAARRNGTDFVAGRFNNRFHLRGASAEALRTLFERPPGATGAITVVGAVLLLFSLLSLARSLQRTFEEAWCLRPLGMRGAAHGLTGLGLLLVSLLVLGSIASVMRGLPAGSTLATVVRAVVAVGVWILLQDLLLSRGGGGRRRGPGAFVLGIAQTVYSVGSGIWMPHVVSKDASRYGVIGVTFAILSWLIVLGMGLVFLVAANAEVGGADGLSKSPQAGGR